ncbi:MAG: TMEM165/GDT1 family protein [Marinisporobacter sp.]|jgi:putative Ca2+/H+ antiporter (TMEM165/GDT1 family)|nr:TMEM165/GDT1 family protein [Marinisporobacter sp.]
MLRIIITSFWIVFIAELGDKTQLQTMLLATQSKSILGVFIGAACALVLSCLLGVFVGSYITKLIAPNYLRIVAGFVFIVFGILTVFGKI